VSSLSFDDPSSEDTAPSLSSEDLSSSLTLSSTSSETIYQGYYQTLQGVNDAQLKPTLTTILRSILTSTGLLPPTTTYGDARNDLAQSDVDPNNPNKIILV
jgi:hypothetical protein